MLRPLKKKISLNSMEIVMHREGHPPEVIPLTKSKILIGSFEHADIRLDDSRVGHYHAFLTFTPEGLFHVIDLNSRNGTFINGQKITQGTLCPGDNLNIGPCSLHLQESVHNYEIEDLDKNLEQMHDEVAPIVLPSKEGLTLIDGEYCDITFDETAHRPIHELPFYVNFYAHDFADYHENNESLDIFKKAQTQAVEISVVTNNAIIHIEHLKLKDGQYHFHPRKESFHTLVLPTLTEEKKTTFLDIHQSEVTVMQIPDHHLLLVENGSFREVSKESNSFKLTQGQMVVYQRNTVQVFIRLVDAPPTLLHPPFFGRDWEFKKKMLQIVGGAMALMLLLLLVDTNVEPEPEKIAVIYKKAQRTEKAQTAEKNSNVDQEQGNQTEKVNDKQLAKAQAPKKQESPKKQNTPTPPKQAAQPATQTPTPAPVDTFKFDLNSTISGAKQNNALKNVQVEAKATTSNAVSALNSSNSSASLSERGTGQVGNLSGDTNGKDALGKGTRGLVSKNGVDTAYVEPKTVVLGSMDPELLRKILKEHLPQFRHCYQQELANNSENIQGVVDLNFRINGNGSVSHVNIKSKGSKFSSQGTNCMSQVLSLIQFPKPKGGGVVDVRQPLNFSNNR